MLKVFRLDTGILGDSCAVLLLKTLSWLPLLVLYDGEHPKRNMEVSALIKIYYYIYVLTKKHDVSLLFSENI